MYTKLFISGLFATAFAAPLVNSRSDWIPEEGTRTTCAPEGNGLVGLFQGADGKELINAACAELMVPCAYNLPQYLPPGPQACKDVVVYPIIGSKTSTQTANILDQDGNKVSGKKLQFTVTPAPRADEQPAPQWMKQDCFGYLQQLLAEKPSETSTGGCWTEEGSGLGSITIGGVTNLKGTELKIQIV